MHAEQPAEVPPMMRGTRAGYPGKAEYNAADMRLRRAMAQLAREADPAARLAGVQLADAAATVLDDLAGQAEAASPKLRAQARRLARQLARIERLTAQSQTPAATAAADQPEE